MKLIIAIVSKDDAGEVSGALTSQNFLVTKLSSTGGFLLSGNTTLLIGTEDENVDAVLEIIKRNSKRRTEIVPSTATYGVGVVHTYPLEIPVGGATIFVLDVEKYYKV